MTMIVLFSVENFFSVVKHLTFSPSFYSLPHLIFFVFDLLTISLPSLGEDKARKIIFLSSLPCDNYSHATLFFSTFVFIEASCLVENNVEYAHYYFFISTKIVYVCHVFHGTMKEQLQVAHKNFLLSSSFFCKKRIYNIVLSHTFFSQDRIVSTCVL